MTWRAALARSTNVPRLQEKGWPMNLSLIALVVVGGLTDVRLAPWCVAASLQTICVAVPGSQAASAYTLTGGTRLQPKVEPAKPGGAEKKPSAPPAPTGKLGPDGYRVSNSLPQPIQDGTQGSRMEVSEHHVTHGDAVLTTETMQKTRNLDKELRIDKFELTDGTVMVQVDVSADSKLSILGKAAAAAAQTAPLLLRSADGQKFEAVGYWYEDDAKVIVRYTRDQPVRTLKDLVDKGVMVSKSRSDQHLYLFFAPSKGVEITKFTVGSETQHEFKPALKLDVVQK